ncbi:uncharacterized protein LOC143209021 [Lasioglossum baleicum]|uniref:uncharacterized protein LOC143209021 n=1 Tax=Lasioglossum baleicum TaxID=434251 RepID=UPI003FCD0A4A
MISRIILLALAIGLTTGQLNFEGSPLTENTEYTAEESRFSERTARQQETAANVTAPPELRSQKLHPIMNDVKNASKNLEEKPASRHASNPQHLITVQPDVVQTSRQLSPSAYNRGSITANPTDYYVNTPVPRHSPNSQILLTAQPEVQTSRQLSPSAYNNRGSITASPVDYSVSEPELRHPPNSQHLITVQPEVVQTSRQLSASAYNQGSDGTNPVDAALTTFLNSKTPEESRMSLDSYLQNAAGSESVVKEQPGQQTVSLANQPQLARQTLPIAPQANQLSTGLSSPVNQHLMSQIMQQRQAVYAFPVNQRQPYNEQLYSVPVNSQDPRAPVPATAIGAALQQQTLQAPYAPGIQSRNDIFYPPGWHQRVRRIRGRPFPYVQSRGGPGLYNAPVPGPYKPKSPPVEVIYTKPPGYNHGPPVLSNPPIPYEDASNWFPEVDHPPPNKDVYYSQLYAQSYDPHYYNYIAKTGKIKPHLYGKLGKYEDEGSGIWAELYRGFKKHGLKNIMTPTFLLGMTLPVVTLMLTALVQKRSFSSRSDSREFSREETIQEYLDQLRAAVECYERKRKRRDTSYDGC